MGKSYTYHVLGMSGKEIIDETNYRRYEVHCMSKLDMVQKAKDMRERGTPIVGWVAQTKTGCKMIGSEFPYWEVPDSQVKQIKTITCPICHGTGGYNNGPFRRACPVCSGSGITKPGYWNKWAEWQVESFKAEFSPA